VAKPRVLFLGLDGLSWSVYRRLRGRGFLRSLAALEPRAVTGSVDMFPPLTPPMWTSMTSGVNPGKHGIYNFGPVDPSTGRRPRLYNALDVDAPRIHDIVSYRGGSSLVVNLPLSSWPPIPFRGALVSDWLSPKDYARPDWLDKSFRRELEERREWSREGPCGKVARDAAAAAALLDRIDKLLDYDYYFIMFSVVDALMHKHPDELLDPREPCIRETLELVDDVFKTLIEAFRGEATIIAASDHGNEPVRYRVTIPRALYEAGLVKPRYEPLERRLRRDRKVRSLPSPVLAVVNALVEMPLLGRAVIGVGRRLVRRRGLFWIAQGVKRPVPDPENSIVVTPLPWYYDFYVNPRYSAEREKIIARVVEVLEEAMKSTGHRFIHRVEPGRHVFHGPHEGEAPDIVLSPAEGYDLGGLNLQAPIVERVDGSWGNHTPYNMHMIAVEDGRPDLVEAAKAVREPWDYAAFALYALGIPQPGDSDSGLCSRARLRCATANYRSRYMLAKRLAARLGRGAPRQSS